MITEKIHLREIAYARSGDKGVDANVGVIAYTEEGYAFLKEHLTAEMVQEYFKPLGLTETIRYELDNLGALNFLLKEVLANPLRVDVQGKTLGQVLLEMEILVPEDIIYHCKKESLL